MVSNAAARKNSTLILHSEKKILSWAFQSNVLVFKLF
jgi:hypothetical protein